MTFSPRAPAEFRHRAWQTQETLELLRALEIGWVNVDEPQFKGLLRPTSEVTGPVAYVRFHVRNDQQWWKGTNETRYDYLYSAEELAPWTDRVIDLAADPEVRETLAFFNNHRRGQAVQNAELFEAMVASKIPKDVVTRRVAGEPPPDDGRSNEARPRSEATW